MMERVSRKDYICEQLIKRAEEGFFEVKMDIYPSEIARMCKQWHVTVVADNLAMGCSTKKYPCTISWSRAFEGAHLNYKHSWYMSRLSEELPETENLAQRLFLITARVRNSMKFVSKKKMEGSK